VGYSDTSMRPCSCCWMRSHSGCPPHPGTGRTYDQMCSSRSSDFLLSRTSHTLVLFRQKLCIGKRLGHVRPTGCVWSNTQVTLYRA
jgi:hypothetical protein